MRVEDTAALRFILQDDIYLLNQDKTTAATPSVQPVAAILPEPVAAIQPEPVIETPSVKLNYLGGHKKAFLVVVHYPAHQFIDDAHLTALQNILKRKDHELDDVAIFNIARSPVGIDELIAYFKPQKLLIMGVKALPVNIGPMVINQPKQLPNCAALYSFGFDEMMDNTENKKAFWEQMKNL